MNFEDECDFETITHICSLILLVSPPLNKNIELKTLNLITTLNPHEDYHKEYIDTS
jgi:hypothetical protein